MKRKLISIISEQAVPNYLFLYTKSFEGRHKYISDLQKVEDSETYLLNELDWNSMMVSIFQAITAPGVKYLVNLTGGTKYISLAVHNAFEKMQDVESYDC